MKLNASYLFGVVFILLLACFLRLSELHDYPPGIYYDDGRKLQRAWRLEEGLGLPLYFQDIAEPFDDIVRSIYYKMSGGTNLFIAQNFTIWLNLLSVASVMVVARRIYQRHPQVYVISLVAGLALATMLPAVMLGRHLYRANWLPMAQMLALASLFNFWYTNKRLHALTTGAFIALATMMYIGGLFSPPAFALVIFPLLIHSRFALSRLKSLILVLIGFLVMMIPWFYLYWRIPNWLMRVSDLSIQNSPLNDMTLLPEHIRITLGTIFFPEPLHDMRYHPYTTGFQHPVFLICLVLGLILSLWRWRDKWVLSPVMLLLVMIWPDILSNEPYQPVRLIGIFAPIALLMAYSIGEFYQWMMRKPLLMRLAQGLLVILFIASPIYTHYHVWNHYHVEPTITNPYLPHSLAWTYRIGFIDLLMDIVESDQPSYLPMAYLNTDLAVAVLRPDHFPTIRAYAGEDLPAGRVVLPINSISFGFFLLEHTPLQYALLLPDSGEIVVLPPIGLDEGIMLENRIRATGQDVLNDEGWILGQSLGTETVNPFQNLALPQADEVLAVFDSNLELIAIDAPIEMQTDALIPVTLYWRLREPTHKDYFSRLQIWDYGNVSQGYELRAPIVNEPDFPLNIHYYAFPTVMWQAGQIVADLRWVPLFETAPSGAYRFALAVFDYPGPRPVTFETTFGLAERQEQWALIGRSAIQRDAYTEPISPSQESLGIIFGDHYELLNASITPELSTASAGDTFSITLDWRVLASTSRSYTQFIHVVDGNATVVAQQDTATFGGVFPTWAWTIGDTLSTRFDIQIPADAQAPFSINTGFYDYPSLERLTVQQNGVLLPDNLLRLADNN